jgi:sulfotransferase family protein
LRDRRAGRAAEEVSIMRQGSPTSYFYIVGRGHSGSTIFSMLVGEARTVASEGEIITGFRRGYEAKRCASGEPFAECPFWSKVSADFERRAGTGFADAVRKLNRRARYGRIVPNLLARPNSSEARESKHLIEALYDSIAEATNRAVVLDSSKELSTAIFLLRHVPEAKLIHFVRSPYGVVDSYVKRIKSAKSFHVFRIRFRVERFYFIPMVIAALLWTVGSFACELLRLFWPKRVITLHYEDLCERPVALVGQLESFSGISLSECKEAAEQNREMQPNHGLSANHLMRRGNIMFSPKKGVPRYLTSFDKAVVTFCTFPMLVAYGYLGRRAVKPAAVGVQQVSQ